MKPHARPGAPGPGRGGGPRAGAPPAAGAARPDRALAVVLAAAALALAAAAAPWADGPATQPAPAAWFQQHHVPALLPAAHADLGKCGHYPGHTSYFASAPGIASIRFTSPDKVYIPGDTIGIRIDTTADGFEQVSSTLDNIPHTLLTLETGDIDRLATHAGGDPSDGYAHLLYNYTVQPGDFSLDLDYNETRALHFGSYTIAEIGGGPMMCYLPAPGEDGSLSYGGDVVVFGNKSDALALAVTPDGVYGVGREITVAVRFAGAAVYSGGAPELALNVSGAQRTAAYKSGNGTSEFLFDYVVQPGDSTDDLDYYGTDSLTGAITNGTGSPVNRTLYAPGAIGSLSTISGVRIDSTAPPLIAAGWATNGMKGFNGLDGAADVDVVAAGGRTYAVVASPVGDAVQLIRVHGNGTLEAAHSVSGGSRTGPVLDYAHGIDAFYMGGDAYALAAAYGANGGVQLLRINGGNGTLSAVSSLPDYSDNNDLELHGAIGVAAFEMNNAMHALVASYWDDGIQLLRIDAASGALSAVSSLRDNSTLALGKPHGVAVFDLGGAKHALVTSRDETAGIQLVRIDAASGALTAVDSLADNDTLALGNPHRVSAFGLEGTMHALVASPADDGIQLIRIDANGTLVPAGSASDGDPGFVELGGAEGMAAFTDDAGTTYALVASRDDDGVQLVKVRAGNGSALASAGWASDGDPGFAELGGAAGAAAFSMGGHRYALVSSIDDDGVQLVRMSAASVVNVTSAAANGTYLLGDEIDITVTFDHPVRASGPVELRLNSGGAAAYRSGNNTAELVFRYEVGPKDYAADLQHAGGGAPFAGGSIRDGALPDLLVGRTLPAAGTGRSLADLKDIAIETPPLVVASVSSPSTPGPHGIGGTILVNVTFNRPVAVEGRPLLGLDTGGAGRNATYAPGMSGGASLLFGHAVRRGDASPDLAYAGPSALYLNGGAITGTVYGLAADLTLPARPGGLSAQGAIVVDGVEPRIANVTSPDADGTYGTGTTINITVRFTEPVSFEPANARPEVPLDTGSGAGGEPRRAVCTPGSAAGAELACAYVVRAGDATADLGHAAGSSLVLGGGAAARDAAGNGLASPARLPASPPGATLGGSKNIALDTAVPGVLRVTSPNDDRAYGRGSEIRIEVVFDGVVEIDPEPIDGGASVPTLRLETGEIDRAALYTGGSGASTLRFVYTVVAGDFSADLNYTSAGALSLGVGALVDEYGNREQSPALPDPGSAASLGGQKDIAVRTVPTVDTVRANYTDTFLKVGQTVGVRVTFSEKVRVAPAPGGAVPYVELDTGRPGAQARAAYSSGNGSHALEFSYPVHHADSKNVLDYDGTGALKANGASIQGAGSGADLALPAPGSAGSLASANIELRPNEAPKIGPLPNRTVSADVELRVDVAAADPERQPVTFSLVGAAPAGAEIDAPTGVLTWTPTEAQRSAQGVNSTYIITVRATDPHMASDTARFTVTVVARPPGNYTGPTIAAIPDAEGREGEEIRFDIAVADDDHGPFVYSLVASADPPPPPGAAVHPNGTFSWTPGYGQSGTHPMTARAADRYGLDGTGAFSVAVLDAEPPWNLPPVIDPVDPQSADEGERLAVSISATDPDAPITYSLAGNLPDGASIDPATGVFTWDIGYDAAGTHTVTVSAADRYGRASSISFAVMVADRVPPNLPPEIGPIPPQRVAAGTALALQVSATDPNEGDVLSFGLVDPPPGAAIAAASGLFTWTPGLDQVGRHVLNVTVADGGGLSNSAPLVVDVVDPATAAAAAAEAVFVGPRAVRIDYNAPLGTSAGHAGPVYGGVTIGAGGSADPAAVSGLGTCTHIVRLGGGAAAGLDQDGSIRLLADLEGAADGILYRLAAGTVIPVGAGEAARMLSPSCMPPVAAIEADGFVRGGQRDGRRRRGPPGDQRHEPGGRRRPSCRAGRGHQGGPARRHPRRPGRLVRRGQVPAGRDGQGRPRRRPDQAAHSGPGAGRRRGRRRPWNRRGRRPRGAGGRRGRRQPGAHRVRHARPQSCWPARPAAGRSTSTARAAGEWRRSALHAPPTTRPRCMPSWAEREEASAGSTGTAARSSTRTT